MQYSNDGLQGKYVAKGSVGEIDMSPLDWMKSDDPFHMLSMLPKNASQRKLRLFACACCRRVMHMYGDKNSKKAIEFAERYADGLATKSQLSGHAWGRSSDANAVVRHDAREAAEAAAFDAHGYLHRWLMTLVPEANERWNTTFDDALTKTGLREAGDIANATIPATLQFAIDSAVSVECRAQSDILRDLFGDDPESPFPSIEPHVFSWQDGFIRTFAESIYERHSFGHLPVLADLLRDAGCNDATILEHSRRSLPHSRGCWVIDICRGLNPRE